MILVDTSIWIDHLRTGNPKLAALLQNGQVLAHNQRPNRSGRHTGSHAHEHMTSECVTGMAGIDPVPTEDLGWVEQAKRLSPNTARRFLQPNTRFIRR